MAKKKSKWKKIAKNVGKAAVLAGALYGGSKLLKGAKGNVSKTAASEDANIGVSHFKDYITKKAKPPVDEGIWGSPWGAKGGGIAKRGSGVALKHGGHVKSMGIAKRGGGVAKK